MELIKPVKQEFMAKFERCEPAARDHSATIKAKECMRLYFYTMVLGFREKETPQFFNFGSAYHKFREKLETEEGPDDKKYVIALAAALDIFQGDPPAGSKYDFLSRGRLMKSCEVAFKHWKQEKSQGNIEVVAVEQPFDVYLSDGKTRRGGKADQVIRMHGRLAGRDWKTSSKNEYFYDRTIEPNDQFTGYLFGIGKLSGEFASSMIVDVLFNTKSKGPTIKSFITSRTEWQMDQWEKEQIHFEKLISACREEDIWPMEEKNCSFCMFRSVCKKGTEDAQIAQLEREFVQNAWDYKNLK
jgi:hypothetical protein